MALVNQIPLNLVLSGIFFLNSKKIKRNKELKSIEDRTKDKYIGLFFSEYFKLYPL